MWNRQVLRSILEKNQAASSTRTPNEQKIGDFYASCMGKASSGTSELAQIQPLLERVGGMRDKREIGAALAAIHSSFGRAWEGSDNQTNVALFGYGPTADYNDVGRVVAGLDQ
jgi:endothelin-converting enzyme/putative endopeptidase